MTTMAHEIGSPSEECQSSTMFPNWMSPRDLGVCGHAAVQHLESLSRGLDGKGRLVEDKGNLPYDVV